MQVHLPALPDDDLLGSPELDRGCPSGAGGGLGAAGVRV